MFIKYVVSKTHRVSLMQIVQTTRCIDSRPFTELVGVKE